MKKNLKNSPSCIHPTDVSNCRFDWLNDSIVLSTLPLHVEYFAWVHDFDLQLINTENRHQMLHTEEEIVKISMNKFQHVNTNLQNRLYPTMVVHSQHIVFHSANWSPQLAFYLPVVVWMPCDRPFSFVVWKRWEKDGKLD